MDQTVARESQVASLSLGEERREEKGPADERAGRKRGGRALISEYHGGIRESVPLSARLPALFNWPD